MLTERTVSISRGMNDSGTSTRYREDEAELVHNFRIAPDGAPEVRGGSVFLNESQLTGDPTCYGVTKRPFVTASGERLSVGFFLSEARVSEDNWRTYSVIASGLFQAYWSLSTMRRGSSNYLLCVNGNIGYSFDGTTWAEIADLPTGVKVGAVYNGRFYVTGHSGPVVEGSQIADFEGWSASRRVLVQVQTHDGDERVLGLFQVGAQLLAFKRHSTSWIDGHGQTDLVVAAGAVGLSRSVGTIGWRTVQPVGDNGCMWLSDRGLEMYTVGRPVTLVTPNLREFFRTVSWSDMDAKPHLADAVWVPRRSEYRCAIPAAGGRNTHELVFNAQTGGTTIFYGAPDGESPGIERFEVSIVDDEPFLVAVGEGSEVRIEEDALSLAEDGEPGVQVYISFNDPYLSWPVAGSASALFVADQIDGETDVVCCGTYNGDVMRLDYGELDAVGMDGTGGSAIPAKLRYPPRLFGAPFNRKYARVVRILGVSEEEAQIVVGVLADGEEVVTRTATVPAGSNRKPKDIILRTAAKGHTIQEEIRTSKAGLRIAMSGVSAEILRERV